jgi:hypothetical protein
MNVLPLTCFKKTHPAFQVVFGEKDLQRPIFPFDLPALLINDVKISRR